MPVYDYKCAEHGLFHQLQTLAKSGEPQPCPQCQALSPRVILIAPEVMAMAPSLRQAMQRNEVAAHEPKKIIGSESAKSCCHDPAHPLKQQVMYHADGSKTFPSQRPWMISH